MSICPIITTTKLFDRKTAYRTCRNKGVKVTEMSQKSVTCWYFPAELFTRHKATKTYNGL